MMMVMTMMKIKMISIDQTLSALPKQMFEWLTDKQIVPPHTMIEDDDDEDSGDYEDDDDEGGDAVDEDLENHEDNDGDDAYADGDGEDVADDEDDEDEEDGGCMTSKLFTNFFIEVNQFQQSLLLINNKDDDPVCL